MKPIQKVSRKKLLIVMDCMFPVPAVSGGAVSTLIESLAKVNEREKRCELYIFTLKNHESKKMESCYPSTTFVTFRTNKWLDKIDSILFKKKNIIKKLSVILQVRKCLKNDNYDYVVLQNFGYLLKVFKDKVLLNKYKGKIYYHLHNDIPSNIDKSIIQHCKLILVSNFLKKKISRICGENVLKQCYIVKNGINVNTFTNNLSDSEIIAIKRDLHISNLNSATL